jgi:hypothetical protein
MTEPVTANLPTTESALPAWITGIPSALVPSTLKALDRLIGAVVDYPVALIKRETAKIEAQAKAFEIVESAIAKSAGELAGADTETVGRALKVLVRKEYRKELNLEAVAAETVSELKADTPFYTEEPVPKEPPNEDWLNVFERFAEDASTERMQGLWGRVLAGEIRQPGRFSLRTLRCHPLRRNMFVRRWAIFAQISCNSRGKKRHSTSYATGSSWLDLRCN